MIIPIPKKEYCDALCVVYNGRNTVVLEGLNVSSDPYSNYYNGKTANVGQEDTNSPLYDKARMQKTIHCSDIYHATMDRIRTSKVEAALLKICGAYRIMDEQNPKMYKEDEKHFFIFVPDAFFINAWKADLDYPAPHDLYLTRNGHGAGFWDKEDVYGEENAAKLTEIAKQMGEKTAYHVRAPKSKLTF